MAKKPGMDIRMYSRPANLPGFLVEFICLPLRESGLRESSLRYAGGGQEVTTIANTNNANWGGAGSVPTLKVCSRSTVLSTGRFKGSVRRTRGTGRYAGTPATGVCTI